MMKAKRGERSPLKVVVTILAIAVAILYVSAGFRIASESEDYSIDYDARDYIYSAESGRYGDLYDTAVRDMNKRATHSAEVAECRALAFYYEQAVLEHAYRATGDDAKADAFAQRMEEYEAQLGSLSGKVKGVRERIS